MPISFERSATERESTPKTPTAAKKRAMAAKSDRNCMGRRKDMSELATLSSRSVYQNSGSSASRVASRSRSPSSAVPPVALDAHHDAHEASGILAQRQVDGARAGLGHMLLDDVAHHADDGEARILRPGLAAQEELFGPRPRPRASSAALPRG